MAAAASKSIVAVSGLGNGVGTGAAVARLFSAQLGYRVALISRPRKEINDLAADIKAHGGVAEVFSLDAYNHACIKKVFEDIKSTWPDGRLKCSVWNTGQWSNIPFLDIKQSDIELSVQINMQANFVAATAFAQESVKQFVAPERDGETKGGTLIMTGATSAWRGSHSFGAFAAGKHGLRALSQSIAREYGPQGVHVSFVVIDGTIKTKRTSIMFGKKFGENWLEDPEMAMTGEQIAKCYLYLHQQEPGAWTLEMDLRPAKEKF
ncbi:short-chain dehydrogenase/reductase SDR [Meredithblackwellia eburnea MCA 4105]